MRKRHWLACLLSMWLSAVGGQAIAQPPPAGIPNNLGNPDLTGMMPPPYNQNYGPTPPQQYGGMPAGYPPGANAWPNITPYGPPVDETSNQNGLWFNRQLTGGKKYYFSLEGLIGNTTRPSNFVGDPQANTFDINTEPGGVFVDHNQQFFETPQGFSTIGTPDRSLDGSGSTGGGTGGTTGGTGTGTATDFPIFLGQSTGSITDRLSAAGMRATWGWTNPDSSGFEASGYFIGPSSAAFFLGDQRPFNQDLFRVQPLTMQDRLHAFAGLPLSGKDSDQDGLPGVVQPFDMYYRLQYTTRSGGANLDWFTTPIIDKPAFMMRAAYGARYMAIRETFQFDGADSGLGYTLSVPTSGGGGTGTGTGVTTTGNGFLSPVTLEPLVALNIMQSLLSSSVTTQLAGPEAGFRFDIGRDKFKIWTTSKLGLLVNYSSRNLSGYNIGDAYYAKPTGTITDPTVMPRNNAAATRFAHEDSTTALSPLFEQSIFGEAKLFQYVPVLKKSKVLSAADFQAGYTVIVVGNVYRPSQDINWQAYPISPLLNDKRGSFITSNYSFGMSWEY
jgi:hypothetical protein